MFFELTLENPVYVLELLVQFVSKNFCVTREGYTPDPRGGSKIPSRFLVT